MIHVKIPFDTEKNLGRAYNKAFEGVADDDWVCLMDHDVLLLTPDAIQIMEEYTKNFPDTGIFTCYASRIHPLSKYQLLFQEPSDNANLEFHLQIAYNQKRHGITVQEIPDIISGFLMLVSKKTWNRIKFPEHGKCLGVDNIFSQDVLSAGLKIYRMNSIYVWHTYRLTNGIGNKAHLM
jgi:GT2 family glycosyltransferase